MQAIMGLKTFPLQQQQRHIIHVEAESYAATPLLQQQSLEDEYNVVVLLWWRH